MRILLPHILVVFMFLVDETSNAVEEISLIGIDWIVSQESGNITVGAQVPGSVYTDLIRHGVIGDPYYRFNDIVYRWISYSDWRYKKTFHVSTEFIQHKRINLLLNGLDTVATVILNNEQVASTNNMFRRYVIDVTKRLKVGDNSIEVIFKSPVSYAKDQAHNYPYPVPPACPPPAQQGECFFNYIRKEACSFSWDWGPAFPTMGIWKDISLEGYSSASIHYVTIETHKIDAIRWNLVVGVFFDVDSSVKGSVTVSIPELGVSAPYPVSLSVDDNFVQIVVEVSKVKPWWPNGYGKPKLYDASVQFTGSSGDVDVRNLKVGFRMVELVQDDIHGSAPGNHFYFRINGIPIFAKGSNWIPADIFQERITTSYLERLLLSAVEANMNMLRVWGGGVYESDDFYNLADKLGIMIWQDFMFACALYPTDKDFLANVHEEVIHQVRRLKHHPSIVIWAGNNENEGALASNWFNVSQADYPRYKNDYIKLYVETIRPVVIKEDSSRPFLCSSPTNGVETEAEGWIAKNPQSPYFGDVHDYNYNRNSWNSNEYVVPRFGSEFGLQSWCSVESLLSVSTPAEDWVVGGIFALHRQHHTNGEKEMLTELSMNIEPSKSTNVTQQFVDFIYLTQINQAVGIKTEVELYRRSQSQLQNNFGYTMGALYWQLNDIWQGPTWASIEYGGKWKMLHYLAKKFFSPVALSPSIDGDSVLLYYINDDVYKLSDVFRMSSDADISGPAPDSRLQDEPNLELFVDDEDDLDDIRGKLRWSSDTEYSYKDSAVTVVVKCFKWDSFDPAVTWNITFTKPHVAAKYVYTSPLSAILTDCQCSKRAECFLHFTDLSSSAPDAYLLFDKLSEASSIQHPTVKVVEVEQVDDVTAKIHISSSNIALFVWLDCPGFAGHFSDNGFLLVQPEITVTFRSWHKFDDFYSFQKHLTVKTLHDVYL